MLQKLQYHEGQQRLYYVRKLKSFKIDNELLWLFYSLLESVTVYVAICWLSCATKKGKTNIQHIYYSTKNYWL